MRISEVHAAMRENGTIAQGPLTDSHTGQRRMQNRGVRREWKALKRADAASRESKVNHLRTRQHRLTLCGCKKRSVTRKSN